MCTAEDRPGPCSKGTHCGLDCEKIQTTVHNIEFLTMRNLGSSLLLWCQWPCQRILAVHLHIPSQICWNCNSAACWVNCRVTDLGLWDQRRSGRQKRSYRACWELIAVPISPDKTRTSDICPTKTHVEHKNIDIEGTKWTSKGCDLWKCQTVE